MRLAPLLLILAASPAAADCTDEIRGLFQGGAWDPFVRENRHEVTVARAPDGSEVPVSEVTWDGPTRAISCTPNGCILQVGAANWRGDTKDGPWTALGSSDTADPEAFVRATSDRLAASVSEALCPGEVTLEGAPAVQYRFFSKPEPNEYGSWWGGRYTVWVSPDMGRILRIELAEGIASWAPEPSPDVQVTTITYDPSIEIAAPE